MFYKFHNLGLPHELGNFTETRMNPIDKTTVRKQIMQNKECLMQFCQYLRESF